MLSIGNIVKKDQPYLFWCMRGLPKYKREAVFTLFAFSRHIGDVLYSPMPVSEKIELLKAWREELDNIYEKHVPQTNIGRKIYKNCLRFNLPKELWSEILDSAFLNADKPLQAPKENIFTQYINGTIIVPFTLSLMIINNEHPKANEELAKNLGQAVGITYMLRDLKDDAKHDRFYIPQEILQETEIAKNTPLNMLGDKNIAWAREVFARKAESSYSKSERLLNKMNRNETLAFRLIKNIGQCQFDIMKKRGWEIISPKPRLNFFQRMRILYQTMVR